MGMVGNYRRVTPEELERLRQVPEAIVTFLCPDDATVFPEDHFLYIDKTWQAIHFLLTGDPWEGQLPLRYAVLGAPPLNTIDVGYGPARVLTPDQVQMVAAVLNTIPPDDLAARFDPAAFAAADIYPSGWGNDIADDLDYILSYYGDLIDFFNAAAQVGNGVIFYLG
jgi:uncharacterized protein DUF1877